MLVPDKADAVAEAALVRTRRIFGDRAYMALTVRRRPRDAIRLRDLAAMTAAARTPTIATNDVLYHAPDRHLLQDVVTCIREKRTIDALGARRERFADRHLKTAAEMERLSDGLLRAGADRARRAPARRRGTPDRRQPQPLGLHARSGRRPLQVVRLGLRMARDLSNGDAAAIVTARGDQLYVSIEEIQRRAGVGRGALDRIGDAMGSAYLRSAI